MIIGKPSITAVVAAAKDSDNPTVIEELERLTVLIQLAEPKLLEQYEALDYNFSCFQVFCVCFMVGSRKNHSVPWC